MGLIVTGSFNWAAFERRSLGAFKESGLRWVFRHAKIAWGYLLQASISHILSHYNLKQGVLVLEQPIFPVVLELKLRLQYVVDGIH